MNLNESDHVVPGTHAVDLFTHENKYKEIHRTLKASTKLNQYNGDFFNLYNELSCSDLYNVSDISSSSLSSLSSNEARVVPTGTPATESNRRYEESLTFDFFAGENSDTSYCSDLDNLERVVIGCESDVILKSKINTSKTSSRRKRYRKNTADLPVASSTMIGSPLQHRSKIRRTISGKDSGIYFSETSESGQITANSSNDRTFVITNSFDVYYRKREEIKSELYHKSYIATIPTISFAEPPNTDIIKSDENFKSTYDQKLFLIKGKGVQRTSTKAKLRSTPIRGGQSRICGHFQTSVVWPSCTLPFTNFIRKWSKKCKDNANSDGKQLQQRDDLTVKKKKDIIMRMKQFRNSCRKNKKDERIQTLAEL